MKEIYAKIVIVILFLMPSLALQAQDLYFPPLTGDEWKTTPISELNWCEEKIDSLYNFLEEKNSKGFIVLKDGKIVLERYFGTFTQDSAWYWASAAKSVIATLIGTAQQSNLININDPTSTYLGEGWTSLAPEQEVKITIRHQMTMTTGLKEPDITGIDNCLDPACLVYGSEPDTRWYYYNSPYRLLQHVLDSATGMPLNRYFNESIIQKTGITGIFLNYILFSKPRSMARFGLLMLGKGKWNDNPVLNDMMYFDQMTNTSQALNPAYGYLWWINGKESFKAPGSDEIFTGSIIPNAPADMFAALGANDQKIYVVPSQNMVVVRVGNSAESERLNAVSSFDNDLWQKIQNLECDEEEGDKDEDPILSADEKLEELIKVYPNPSAENYFLKVPNGRYDIVVRNSIGKEVFRTKTTRSIRIPAAKWKKGMYLVEITPIGTTTTTYLKLIKE